ncbi:MAG: prepilin-type N-terminal cleavage/methylation domain-containing protein [Alphaproteobacteria bacterium]|nr:prepilin-type N-terminal cleavage/methylation domain-containing protein [Alphaproteobacteria bacterium]
MAAIPPTQRGFTLLEISIVIVIIGLIAGGILAGRNLIEAANIRATVSQYEKYKTATNTFRLKYNSIPGDMNSAEATAVGFLPTTRNDYSLYPTSDVYYYAYHAHMIFGNGLIENSYGDNPFDINSPWLHTMVGFLGESALFWQDLSSAGLISPTFSSITDTNPSVGLANYKADTLMRLMPVPKIGKNAYWYIASGKLINYFGIIKLSSAGGAIGSIGTALTPYEAYSIDTKLDDGIPDKGSVQASAADGAMINNTNPSFYSACATSTNNGDPTSSYKLNITTNSVCNIVIKAGF